MDGATKALADLAMGYVERHDNKTATAVATPTPNKHEHEAAQIKEFGKRMKNWNPESDDHLPAFQRTVISHAGQVPTPDSETAFDRLVVALHLRQKYMERSLQEFPEVTARFLSQLDSGNGKIENVVNAINVEHKVTNATSSKESKEPPPRIDDPWNIELPENIGFTFKMNQGIIQIYDANSRPVHFPYPSFEEHVKDLHTIAEIFNDGPTRTFSNKRLNVLRSKYDIHMNLNEVHELAQCQAVPYRDFYNVLKVDTHIHAAGCMSPKEILGCIKDAYEKEPNIPVLPGKSKGDPPQTLSDVFKDLKLDPEALSVDALNCSADRDTMNRFDLFNSKYNVAGNAGLRKVFLKASNSADGKYFASLLKEVIGLYEKNGHTYSELRKGAGDGKKDWTTLSKWAIDNKLYSDTVRWGIQVARTYAGAGSFQEFLEGIFMSMFEATSDPRANPEISKYLTYCYGFDSVDDESKPEDSLLYADTPTADLWTSGKNPPYSYYSYYMHANMTILNHFRRARGMNLFTFRPHCGEAGSPIHLASSFLLAENISHGIELAGQPTAEYLYYLAQIPIALSPLSNNALFLPITKHPLRNFFSEGIPVCVSTDDPLMFHYTNEPLLEEYAVAAQVFQLSCIDICEMARNSVVMCGFPENVKEYWLGKNWRKLGVAGNDIGKTNVPNERVAYRIETLMAELLNLVKGTSLPA